MEIRVEERLSGQAHLGRLLAEYGGLEALKAAAKGGRATARSDLADVELLLEDSTRLQREFRLATVTRIAPSDLERLTPARMKLLALLARRGGPAKVGTLTSELGRDKKNVSRDVQVLKGLGLVEARRRGRETFVQPLGNEIRISLGT